MALIYTVECLGECSKNKPYGKLNWDFLGPIYCISLKENPKRTLRAKRELCRAGMCGYAKMYQPDKDKSTHVPRPGIRGCWESHRALSFEEGNPCVFEDDMLFSKDIKNQHARIKKAFEYVKTKKWDIFCLGCFPIGMYKTKNLDVKELGYFQGLHAYIMGDSAKQWLQGHPYDEMKGRASIPQTFFSAPETPKRGVLGIDMYLTQLDHMFMLYPTAVYQAGHHDPETRVTTNPKNNHAANILQKMINPETQIIMEKTLHIEEGLALVAFLLIMLAFFAFYRDRKNKNY